MTAYDASHVRAAVTTTVADMDALGLTGADRAVALGVVLASRLGLSGGAAPAEASVAQDPGGQDGGGQQNNTGDGLLAKIATVTKIDAETVAMIYDGGGDGLGYVLSPRKLAPNKAEATRQLARIVLLGRQAAGLEEWTASSVIREVVNEYGKFDQANFAAHLTGLDKDNAVLFRGRGSNREIKVTRSGVESMSEATKALVAAS